MCNLCRKLLLLGKHFFEWLKTANISIVCGTVTLKSPPPRGSDAPHVHPRLRKRPPRCTLDCGFKTSESPALRGFVGGPQALATAALYLVIFSNGLRHSKNPPVKFSFSLKIVPATIAKKLPPQVPSQTISHHDFQLLAQMARACFCGQKWVHTRLCSKDRTQRHTRRNRGFPPSATARSCAASEIATERIAGESGCTPMACVRFLRRRGPAGLRSSSVHLQNRQNLLQSLLYYGRCDMA